MERSACYEGHRLIARTFHTRLSTRCTAKDGRLSISRILPYLVLRTVGIFSVLSSPRVPDRDGLLILLRIV